MRYKSFRIRNFKGIQDTTVTFSGAGGPAVFAFVGLNESGKTTVLEAIHSFAPDDATSELVGGEIGTGVPFAQRVPRHLISTFTGDVSVKATIELNDDDKEEIARVLKKDANLLLDIESLPNEVELERQQQFNGGDFQIDYFSLRTKVQVKKSKQHRWRPPSEPDEHMAVRDAIYKCTPNIAYFPTFVFDFPRRIFLTDRGDEIDRFYRSVFQDILDFDGRGHAIERDIVRRVRTTDLILPWLNFFNSWQQRDDREKIQHVMDRAGAVVTKVVFGRWNKIFGEDTKGKEVVVTSDVVEGEKKDANGVVVKTNEHDISVKFQIRDGTRRFDVNDRSLGFRWFFAFMLFTQFRVARSDTRPLLFLFDEPAANLHAAAQQKLIDSFPEIAKGDHVLAYSTHSHYMIEPKWLEQTFIVTNRADTPIESIVDATSLDDESLDIQVTRYRQFVNKHPNQTSYFQPILDRLEVVPSRFDIQKASLVVEGKSDYYVLRYAALLLNKQELSIIPGLGAGTFGALVALHLGWNLRCLFLLDGDSQGKAERDRYIREYGISAERMKTTADFVSDISKIEDLLDVDALNRIKNELGVTGNLTKSQIWRFFQERLASNKIVSLGKVFRAKSKKLIDAVAKQTEQA